MSANLCYTHTAKPNIIFCYCYNLLRLSLSNNEKQQSSGMKVATRRDKLDFSDLLYVNIDAYMPHIYML